MKSAIYMAAVYAALFHAYTSLADNLLRSNMQICKPVVTSSSEEGAVCADVEVRATTLKLSRIRYRNYDSPLIQEAPIKFRRGTAAILCQLFSDARRPVEVEVKYADGVSLPLLDRAIAAAPVPMTSYDEVTCALTP